MDKFLTGSSHTQFPVTTISFKVNEEIFNLHLTSFDAIFSKNTPKDLLQMTQKLIE